MQLAFVCENQRPPRCGCVVGPTYFAIAVSRGPHRRASTNRKVCLGGQSAKRALRVNAFWPTMPGCPFPREVPS